MDKPQQRRVIIISIYLVIFILAGYFFYSLLQPEETCFDKIKNQNEEDIDCGGVCQKCVKIEAKNLIISSSGAIPSTISGEYDFWAQISNPNGTFGSSNFRYEISFKDSVGNILARENGESFILPGEQKYVVKTNMKSAGAPSNAEIKILDSTWVEFNEYYERPQIKIINKSYNELSSGVGFSEAKGLLKNESPYDFTLITIGVVLRDAQGQVIALNSTKMNTVKSGEDREFRTNWPNQFAGAVNSLEVQAEVNVFDSQSFVQRYFKAQKFQEYPEN